MTIILQRWPNNYNNTLGISPVWGIVLIVFIVYIIIRVWWNLRTDKSDPDGREFMKEWRKEALSRTFPPRGIYRPRRTQYKRRHRKKGDV